MDLPKQKVKALHQSPNNLIIFSKPKVGKTVLIAELPNALLIDLEKGSNYVDAMKVQANSIKELYAIGDAIIADGKPYDYIALDTITALEDMCIPYAEILYSEKASGKNWFKADPANPKKLAPDSGKAQYGNILNLPNGGGYAFLREAMTRVIERVKTWAPRIILMGHIKDVQLEKAGGEFTSSDLDLTGKIKRIIASQSDAIGYLYRGKNNQNILSFATTDAVACGARPGHLRNAEIVISELVDDVLVTHWDKIYID
jgi:AAA domain